MNKNIFKKNLSAIVLCGGRGERLKPLTNKVPKPLIKIDGKEILGYILSHLKYYEIKNSFVLTGYKHDQINKFVKEKFKANVNCIYTGQNIDLIKRIKKSIVNLEKYILICYGDTLVDISIDNLINYHNKLDKLPTMSIFETKTNFGIVKFDSNNLVTNFLEKPNLNLWINVGYFIFKKSQLIKYCNNFNTYKDLLHYLGKSKKIKVFKHKGNHITINTALELEEAKQQIKNFKN
tara:strand:- start:87 stop:791 length:705 start_codon:yes stop_codon:yes gene_type:complete